ncbi:unnamed protein product [Parajaminaea phylloscopi]
MAKGASKKVSSQNASSLKLLLLGGLVSNASQLFSLFVFRHSFGDVLKYVLSSLVALAITLLLRDMASKGEDLNAEGLTALLWDVVFVTWFVHVGTAFVWRRFWWLYALIPCYGLFLGYTKLVVPFVFKGQDPLASVFASLRGRSDAAASSQGRAATAQTGANADADSLSKRQKKLQARADRGDPRVQRREVKRG